MLWNTREVLQNATQNTTKYYVVPTKCYGMLHKILRNAIQNVTEYYTNYYKVLHEVLSRAADA
jgi:hypothetical protein